MAHVNCPKCGQRLHLPPIQEAQGVRCPACKHEFTVSPPSQPQPLPDEHTAEGMGVVAKTSKRNKYVGLLVLGVGLTIFIHGVDLSRLIIYFVVLSIIAIIVAADRRDVRRFWFPALAWLFLASGIVDIVAGSYIYAIQRPQIEQVVQELVESRRRLNQPLLPEQDLYYRQATDHFVAGRFVDTIAACKKTLGIDPNHAEAYYWMGAAYLNLGQHTEAIAACKKAIAIKPDCFMAYNNMGLAYHNLGQHTEAIAACKKAIAINPDCFMAYNNMGLAYHNRGRSTDAIVAFEKAIAIKPDLAKAYYNMGAVHRDARRYADEIAAYKKAITIEPSYADAYYNMGAAHIRLRQYGDAIAVYTKAIELNPDDAGAYYHMGLAYVRLEQNVRAIAAYKKAIALKPTGRIAEMAREAIRDLSKSPPPILQPDWQRVVIPTVGTVDIPPSMEVQGEALAKIKEALAKINPLVSSNKNGIVIQPKGMNDLDREALSLYMRVMCHPETRTDAGELADLLNSGNDAKLRSESKAFRADMEARIQGKGKILQWDSPTFERIGGVPACCERYKRQLGDNPPVVGLHYRFLVNGSAWSLTIAYREKEKDRWANFIPTIVDSFRIN